MVRELIREWEMSLFPHPQPPTSHEAEMGEYSAAEDTGEATHNNVSLHKSDKMGWELTSNLPPKKYSIRVTKENFHLGQTCHRMIILPFPVFPALNGLRL